MKEKVRLSRKEALKYFNNNFLKFLLSLNLEGNLKKDGKGNIRCLNPEHEDKNPSMFFQSKYKRLKCCACGISMNIFDVISVVYGLKSFNEQVEKAAEIFNIEIVDTDDKDDEYVCIGEDSTMGVETQALDSRDNSVDYTDFIKEAINNTADEAFRNYLSTRGIFKNKTIKKFQLGYVPSHKFYNSISQIQESHKALVIPYSDKGLCFRCIDDADGEVNKYSKTGRAEFLNIEALDNDCKYVVVCEGEFDALSIYEAGAELGVEGISLGSVSNVSSFLKRLKDKLKDGNINKTFIIELDNDEAGRKACEKLTEGFTKLKLDFVADIELKRNFKDINEAFVKDNRNFMNIIENIEEEVNEKREDECKKLQEKFKREYGIASKIGSLIDWYERKHEEPQIRTCFLGLDSCLNGGLDQGLYIIGGTPGAGKTAFLLQIADNVSASEIPVLYFSLEMSVNELVTRSLSRLSYLIATDKTDKEFALKDAFTYGQLIQHKSADNCVVNNEKQKCLFDKCLKLYEEHYARNLFIIENEGNITVDDIEKTVDDFVRAYKKTPAIIVDYLQILDSNVRKNSLKEIVDDNIKKLKLISNRYSLPILIASSMNRESYGKSTMAAYKESGGIEYGVDVAIVLNCKDNAADNKNTFLGNYSKISVVESRKIEMKILKNRNGVSRKTIDFNYYSAFHFYEEVLKKF